MAGTRCVQTTLPGTELCSRHKDKKIEAPITRVCILCTKTQAARNWYACDACKAAVGSEWKISYHNSIVSAPLIREKCLKFLNIRTGFFDVISLQEAANECVAFFADDKSKWKTWRYQVTYARALNIVDLYNKHIPGTPLVLPPNKSIRDKSIRDMWEHIRGTAEQPAADAPPQKRSKLSDDDNILDVLGIKTQDDYKSWCSRNHPDKVPARDTTRAAQVFARVSAAVAKWKQ